MKKKVTARAPGKLIISGEYAAFYGMPVIAFAIDEFTETIASIIPEDFVEIELKDYNFKIKLSFDSIGQRYLRTQERYNNFLSGALPVYKVLEEPVDLCCFIISKISKKQTGIKLSIKSTVPIASGFGSSASVIVSLIKALDSLLGTNLTQEDFYKLALEAENLVHGYSSGIDIATSIAGGCNYFSKLNSYYNSSLQVKRANPPSCFDVEDRLLRCATLQSLEGRRNYDGVCDIATRDFRMNSPEVEFISIFTGKPEISTGETIVKARNLLKISDRKCKFKEVTLNLKDAFENKNLLKTMNQIRNNNELLKELGVVPKKVQRFIEEIEICSGAAKICGSGAVAGENAGAVIAIGNFDCINEIAKKFNYIVKRVKPSNIGAHVL